jgi:hypothetical protein
VTSSNGVFCRPDEGDEGRGPRLVERWSELLR